MTVPGPDDRRSERAEWFRLFNECADGSISDADRDALAELLKVNREARETWFSFHDVEVGLTEWAKRGAAEKPAPAVPPRGKSMRRGFAIVAAIACACIAAVFFIVPRTPIQTPVVHVVKSEGAKGVAEIKTRVEIGAGSRFPTIEAPFDLEAIDSDGNRAFVPGKQDDDAPSVVLLDPRGKPLASAADAVVLEQGENRFVRVDFGRKMSVEKVNTYSLGRARPTDRGRAARTFSVYGYDGDAPPGVEGPLTNAGWVLLARVDGEAEGRPGQLASSIAAVRGPIGRYRYLLWQFSGKRSESGQIDVYAEP